MKYHHGGRTAKSAALISPIPLPNSFAVSNPNAITANEANNGVRNGIAHSPNKVAMQPYNNGNPKKLPGTTRSPTTFMLRGFIKELPISSRGS